VADRDRHGGVRASRWELAMTHAQQGRAFLATEWGVNGLPWAQSALATGGDGDALMLAQAEVVYEK
jgi:hypothetical protein